MQAWLERDSDGVEFLSRSGTGWVTAVTPFGLADRSGRYHGYRVEITCASTSGRPRAIRMSAHPLVAANDPLRFAAEAAFRETELVHWCAQWHRHDWIPGDLSITTLNLSSDARCVLTQLSFAPASVYEGRWDRLEVGAGHDR